MNVEGRTPWSVAAADARGVGSVANDRADRAACKTDEPTVVVRELGLSDIDELMAWRMEVLETVFADDGPWDRPALRAANRAYYEHELGTGHVACVVSVGGQDAGCGAICLQHEMPSPDNPSGRCAYVMNVYTRPAFRHQGVAASVLAWLVAQARSRGAQKIYLEATEAGAPLYSELGFRPMEAMMKLADSRAESNGQ